MGVGIVRIGQELTIVSFVFRGLLLRYASLLLFITLVVGCGGKGDEKSGTGTVPTLGETRGTVKGMDEAEFRARQERASGDLFVIEEPYEGSIEIVDWFPERGAIVNDPQSDTGIIIHTIRGAEYDIDTLRITFNDEDVTKYVHILEDKKQNITEFKFTPPDPLVQRDDHRAGRTPPRGPRSRLRGVLGLYLHGRTAGSRVRRSADRQALAFRQALVRLPIRDEV